MARSPEQLGAVASYRPYAQTFGSGAPKQVLINQADDQYHGDLGSTRGTALTGYNLRLPGTTGNNASTPSGTHLNLTDLDVAARVKFSTTTPATNQTIVGRWGNQGANERSWALQILTTGTLRAILSVDGSAFSAQLASSAIPFAAGVPVWVRFTRVAATGASSFFWSTDGQVWTPMGSSASTAFAPHSAAFPIEVGSSLGGSNDLFAGAVYAVTLRDGIDGTILASPLFDQQPAGTGSFADAQGNTWTINAASADTNDPVFGGTGLAFSTDDYVQRDQLVLYGAALSVFAAVAGASGSNTVIYSSSSSSDADPLFAIRNASGNADVLIKDNSGNTLLSLTSTADAFDGSPHTIAVTDDGAVVSLYLDGRLEDSDTKAAGTLTLNRATIGAIRSTTTTGYFTGTIHALDNFQAALRPDQVAQLHEFYRRQLAPKDVTLPAGPAALRSIRPGINNGLPILIRPGVHKPGVI